MSTALNKKIIAPHLAELVGEDGYIRETLSIKGFVSDGYHMLWFLPSERAAYYVYMFIALFAVFIVKGWSQWIFNTLYIVLFMCFICSYYYSLRNKYKLVKTRTNEKFFVLRKLQKSKLKNIRSLLIFRYVGFLIIMCCIGITLCNFDYLNFWLAVKTYILIIFICNELEILSFFHKLKEC